jgi:DNA primase
LVSEARERLWKPVEEGPEARAYLHRRGLTDETIRAYRLGFVPSPLSRIRGQPQGILVPWFDGDELTLIKIRQPTHRRPKYMEVFRKEPTVFPSPRAIIPGRQLIIVEGEFDAILLGQELGDLANVVTLGSASNRLHSDIIRRMLSCPIWHIATDADDAGNRAASSWPARARRVKPPGPFKDWTEAVQGRLNLRRWWKDRLGGTEAPTLFTWDELAAQRWGPALNEQPEADDGPDPYALAERGAIQRETER